MDDEFDLDLVDELCSSFSTPSSSQKSQNGLESSTRTRRKRTSTMSAILETSIVKKVCFEDLTNRSTRDPLDEFSNLDESALELMVKKSSFFVELMRKTTVDVFSVKNGKLHHNFLRFWIALPIF